MDELIQRSLCFCTVILHTLMSEWQSKCTSPLWKVTTQCNHINKIRMINRTSGIFFSFLGANCKTQPVSVPPSSQPRYKECRNVANNKRSSCTHRTHWRSEFKYPDYFPRSLSLGLIWFSNMIPEENFASIENRWEISLLCANFTSDASIVLCLCEHMRV